MPSATIRSTIWRQRTGAVSWASSRPAHWSACWWGRASTLATTGTRRRRTRRRPAALSALGRRGHERCVEGAAHREGSTLRAPDSLAIAVASAMASGSPAITTWPAPLLLATHTSPAGLAQADATTSSSAPRTAAMVPGRASAAACMAAPRSVTRRTPSSRRTARPRSGRCTRRGCDRRRRRSAPRARDGVVHDEAQHVGGEAARSPCAGARRRQRRGGVADVAAARVGGGGDDRPGGVVDPRAAHPGCWDPWPGNVKASIEASDRPSLPRGFTIGRSSPWVMSCPLVKVGRV